MDGGEDTGSGAANARGAVAKRTYQPPQAMPETRRVSATAKTFPSVVELHSVGTTSSGPS
jgi:hypothetical protein